MMMMMIKGKLQRSVGFTCTNVSAGDDLSSVGGGGGELFATSGSAEFRFIDRGTN